MSNSSMSKFSFAHRIIFLLPTFFIIFFLLLTKQEICIVESTRITKSLCAVKSQVKFIAIFIVDFSFFPYVFF